METKSPASIDSDNVMSTTSISRARAYSPSITTFNDNDVDDATELITLVELTLCVWPALDSSVASPDPDSLFLIALARTIERCRNATSALKITCRTIRNPMTTAAYIRVEYSLRNDNLVESPSESVNGQNVIKYRQFSAPLNSRVRMALWKFISRDSSIQLSLSLHQADDAILPKRFALLTLLESQLLPLYNYLWWFEPESFAAIGRSYYGAALPIYASFVWPSLERKRQLNKLFTLFGREVDRMQQQLLDDAIKTFGDICRALDDSNNAALRTSTHQNFMSGQQQPSLIDLELYAVLAPLVRVQWKSTALRMQFYSLHYDTFQRIVRYVDAVHAFCFPAGGISSLETPTPLVSSQPLTKFSYPRVSAFVRTHFMFVAAVISVNGWLLYRSGRLERWAQQMPFLLAALATKAGEAKTGGANVGTPVEKEVFDLYLQHKINTATPPFVDDAGGQH